MRPIRRLAQMIFQDPYASLDPRMTVGDAIAEPLADPRHRHGRRSAPTASPTCCGASGSRPTSPRAIRTSSPAASASASASPARWRCRPKLIVADESVAALDVSVRGHVLDLMLELQEAEGLAYLFISHDMAVVERMTHEVAVMREGEIVEYGPRRAVFESPRTSLHPSADGRRAGTGSAKQSRLRDSPLTDAAPPRRGR